MQQIASQRFSRRLRGQGASGNSEAVLTDDGPKLFPSV